MITNAVTEPQESRENVWRRSMINNNKKGMIKELDKVPSGARIPPTSAIASF